MQVIGWIVLGAWVMALLRTIVNLLAVRPIRTDPPPERTPLVSLLIPARNEERAIERTVRALLAQTYPNFEIFVVNDRSTDATGEILGRIASEDARLTVLAGEEPPAGWLGKPWALHQASLRAKGELLMFIDADVLYEPETVSASVAYLERKKLSLVALLPHFEMGTLGEQIAIPMMPLAALSIMPLWLANRSRFAFLAIGGGPGMLVRRADYDKSGGHERLRAAVVDDVALAQLIRRTGHRTEAVRADRLVSVRMYVGLREVVEGFTKNAFAVFGNHLVVAVLMITLLLAFHLMPFVVALTRDRVAIATVATITLTRLILFAALRYPLLNALLAHPPMTLVWSWILIRSAWLGGVRNELTWRGRTYDASKTRFGAD